MRPRGSDEAWKNAERSRNVKKKCESERNRFLLQQIACVNSVISVGVLPPSVRRSRRGDSAE